jgi:hypothetical protein
LRDVLAVIAVGLGLVAVILGLIGLTWPQL